MLRVSCHKLLIGYLYPLILLCSVVTGHIQRNYTNLFKMGFKDELKVLSKH